MRAWQVPGTGSWRPTAWRLFQLAAVLLLGFAGWRVLGHIPYRIDIDVYRMGAQAWLSGRPLYSDGAIFHTQAGLDLPFTYPPLAAIAFVPFAWLPLPMASAAVTATTLALLVVSILIVLNSLDVWPSSTVTTESAVTRRLFLSFAIVGVAVIHVEPIQANLAFGQINAILMTLVLADCLLRRTPWPRGVLLGLAIALKLTPAVFLLYFALRRDGRTIATAIAAFVAATAAAFAMAWQDSLEYWTATVRNTERIGGAALNTNQNLAGVLARLELGRALQFTLWTVACFMVLGLTIWAVRRVLRANEPELALICVALFGLVVSPVSWSHHWVWALPTVVIGAAVAYRRRNVVLGVVTAAGALLVLIPPISLLPEHQETAAAAWRQLVGASYVWWALTMIAVAGGTVAGQATRGRDSFNAPSLTSAA